MGKINNVKIVYYSGTGCTKLVAETFERILIEKKINVNTYSVSDKEAIKDQSEDLVMVIYAVHACNAPEAVYQWISKLPLKKNGRAAVISVSGGGDVLPNIACRYHCIKRLEKKDYRVRYEKMLVMPSNWIVETTEPLALKLLEVLPTRAEHIINKIQSGVIRRTKPRLIDHFLSDLGEFEKFGAHEFGKHIKCNSNCTGCGWCSRHCPSGNIKIVDKRAVFGKQCHLCLNCLYGCPQKALVPGVGKFVLIKKGFDLEELQKKLPYPDPVDVERLAKGYLWAGVKKYLLENE